MTLQFSFTKCFNSKSVFISYIFYSNMVMELLGRKLFSWVVLFLRRSSDGAVQPICYPHVDDIFMSSLWLENIFKKNSL